MNYKFENKREMLLVEYTYYNFSNCKDELKKRFFKIIELVIFDMVKTDSFFGQIIVQMGRRTQIEKKRGVTLEINIDEFQFMFNPLIFLQFNFEEMKKKIIHEILHLFFQHPVEYQKFQNKVSKSVLIQALDKDLEDKKNGKKNSLEKIIKEYESKEEQMKIGQKKIEDKKQDFLLEKENYEDFHSDWNKNGNFDLRTINKVLYKIVENVLEKDRGILPGYLEEYFQKLLIGKEELKWQQILKSELGKLPVPYKKTITRKDRRQPERLDVKGRLSKNICKVFVAIDTSGSMGEKELEYAFNEIFNIIKYYEYKLSIIECDCIIEKVYKVKTKKDIQFKVSGRGGTAFQPVFDYLKNQREKDYLLIYFTDGYGEKELKEKPKNGRIIWLITDGSPNNLSLQNPYGLVRGLDYKK
ncbi:MAG: vWA domain-containing protein [Fusobacteriaceae bacterium]